MMVARVTGWSQTLRAGTCVRRLLLVQASPSSINAPCDAFFETSLGPELSARGIRRLIIAGCMTQYCIDTTVRRSVSLGFDVVLVGDGHMTADAGSLRFEQIIAHHNELLDGFDAGEHEVRVVPTSEITF